MTSRILLALLFASASLTACAQAPSSAAQGDGEAPKAAAAPPGAPAYPPGTPEAAARQAILGLSPDARIESIGAAPIDGFRQVLVGGQVLYVSDDGRYLMQGTLFDMQEKRVVGEEALAGLRRQLVASVPAADRIVFAPPDPRHTVTVFTDVECGYCRRMHQEIDAYNRQGIAVEYLAFPRMGPASEDFRKMEAVWCAKDRNQALTDAKNGRSVKAERCKNPVAMQHALGMRAGLTGTPMILAEDGTQMGGYLPPAELRARLDELAAEEAPQAAATPAASGS